MGFLSDYTVGCDLFVHIARRMGHKFCNNSEQVNQNSCIIVTKYEKV